MMLQKEAPRKPHRGFLVLLLKFGYSEKATKFEKIFHLEFDANVVGMSKEKLFDM